MRPRPEVSSHDAKDNQHPQEHGARPAYSGGHPRHPSVRNVSAQREGRAELLVACGPHRAVRGVWRRALRHTSLCARGRPRHPSACLPALWHRHRVRHEARAHACHRPGHLALPFRRGHDCRAGARALHRGAGAVQVHHGHRRRGAAALAHAHRHVARRLQALDRPGAALVPARRARKDPHRAVPRGLPRREPRDALGVRHQGRPARPAATAHAFSSSRSS